MTVQWQLAEPKNKKYKIFLWGPEGCFKTRTALRLANVPDDEEPAAAVIDTEFGTDHYGGEFRFLRFQTVDDQEVEEAVDSIIARPGKIKTLIIDSFSLYYKSLVDRLNDLFLKRELNSVGNKREYYVNQPRDYQQINREVNGFIRKLLAADLHIIAIGHAKDLWGDDMKVIGKTFDGPRSMPHYFDTVIQIEDDKKGLFRGVVKRKDRTNALRVGEAIAWSSDEVACSCIVKAFGHDLSSDAVVREGQAVNAKKRQKAASGEKPAKQEPGQEPAPEPVKTEDPRPEATEQALDPSQTPEACLNEVLALKRELSIVSKTAWTDLLAPFGVQSARDMTPSQLSAFVEALKKLRPTESPQT